MFKKRQNNKNKVKQLSINEWKYFFKLYETDYKRFIDEYFNKRGITKNAIRLLYFRNKFKKYIYNNFNEEVIMRKPNKSTKPKITPEKRKELWKELIDSLPNDLVAELVEDWYDKSKDTNENKQKIKKIIEKSKLSSRKLATIFSVSKSYICNTRKGIKKIINIKKENLYKVIIEIFKKYEGRFGRKPISIILKRDYNITLSYRQVARIMKKLDLVCIVRTKIKVKEQKNTKYKCQDFVKRDYHNKEHKQRIYATDVTYLPAPSDVNTNHVFLSAIIDHKTKHIEGYCLSKYNDTNLVLDTFNNKIKIRSWSTIFIFRIQGICQTK